MKNSTLILLISMLFCSCAKESDFPIGNPNSPVPPPPPATPVQTSSVTVSINGMPMTITSLSYNRQTGGAAGVWITVANDLQKVTAVASPFTEFGAGGYTCKVEVSYFARPDNSSAWGVSYPRLVPRNDKIMFNECTPLRSKILSGNFSGSFVGSAGTKDEHNINVTGNFSLVF